MRAECVKLGQVNHRHDDPRVEQRSFESEHLLEARSGRHGGVDRYQTRSPRTQRRERAGEGPVGKRLGFLAQELGREINTIGSKANDAAMQHAVVAMKGELERFREQLENLE